MSLVERVEAATAEGLKKREADAPFRELMEFLAQKQKEGVVLKKTYDLPPIDTIGRHAYRAR